MTDLYPNCGFGLPEFPFVLICYERGIKTKLEMDVIPEYVPTALLWHVTVLNSRLEYMLINTYHNL